MDRIRLGIRAHDLKADSFDGFVKKAAEFGFKNFHFAPNKLPFLRLKDKQFNYGATDLLDRSLAVHDLSIFVMGCYVNIIDPDVAARERQLSQFENYLTAATWFSQSPIIGTETGSVSAQGYTPDNFTAAAYDRLVASVTRLASFAERVGATMALEPGVNHPLYSLEVAKRLFTKINSPRLKLIFDPVNLITMANYQQHTQLIDDFLNYFGNDIISFHLKDFVVRNGQIVSVPFGDGQLDKGFYLKRIATDFPDAFCSLEELPEAKISSAVSEIKKWVQIEPR